MPAITLDPITGQFASAAALNNRFQILEDVINNNVAFKSHIDGYTPDVLGWSEPLNMNLKPIYNLPAPLTDFEPVRLVDVKTALMSALGMVPIVVPVQTTSPGQTDFITVASWFDEAGAHRVSVDGQLQVPDVDYTIFDATAGVLRFTTAPSTNSKVSIVAFAPNVAPPGGGQGYSDYYVVPANTDTVTFQALDAEIADTFDLSLNVSPTELVKIGRIDGGYVGQTIKIIFPYSYTSGGSIYSAIYDFGSTGGFSGANIDLPASMTSYPQASTTPFRTHLPAVVCLTKAYDDKWRLNA